jgi:flagellar biogenesis protein FliO
MPELRFEPTITAPERAKTAHASDRSATVFGIILLLLLLLLLLYYYVTTYRSFLTLLPTVRACKQRF